MTVPVDNDFHDFVKAQNRTRQGCWIQWMLNANLDLPTPDFSPTMSNHDMQRLYRQHILRKSIRSRSGTLPASPHPTTFRTRHAMSFSESSDHRPHHRMRPSLSPIAGSSGCIKSIERGRKESPTKPLESRIAKKDLAKAATLAACLPDNEDTTENESENEAKDDEEDDMSPSELDETKKTDKKPPEDVIKILKSPEKIKEHTVEELPPTPAAKERTRRASTRLQKLREMKDKLTAESSKKLPVKRDIFNGSLMPSRKARSTKKSEEKPPSEADEPFEILDELSDVKKDPEKLEEAESTTEENQNSVEKLKPKTDVEMIDLSETDKSDKESFPNVDKKITTDNSKKLTRKRNSSENFMSPVSSTNSTPVKMTRITSPGYSLPVPDLQLSKKALCTPMGSSPVFSRSSNSPMSRSPRVGRLPGLPASKISAYLDNFPLPKLVTAPNPVFIPTDLFPGVIDDEPVLTDDIYDILEDLKIDPPKPEKIAAFDNIPTDDLDVSTLDKLEAAIDVTDLLEYVPPMQEKAPDIPVTSGESPLTASQNVSADTGIPLVVNDLEKETQVKSFPVNVAQTTSIITIPPKTPESPINVLSTMLQKMMPGRDLQSTCVSSQTQKTTTIAVHSIAPITTIIQVDSIEKLKKGEAVIGRKIIPTGTNAFAVAVPNSIIAVKHKETTESRLVEMTEYKYVSAEESENKEEKKKVSDKNHKYDAEPKKQQQQFENTTESKDKEEPETKDVPKIVLEKKNEVTEETEKEEGPVIYTSPVGHRTRSLSSGRVTLKPTRRTIRRNSLSEDDKENASKKNENKEKSKIEDACLTENNAKSSPVNNSASDDKINGSSSEKNIEETFEKKCSFSTIKTTTEKDVDLQKEQPIVLHYFEPADSDDNNANVKESIRPDAALSSDEKKEIVDCKIIKAADSSTVEEVIDKRKMTSEEEKQSETETTRVRNKKGRFLSFEQLGIKNKKTASKKEVSKAKDEKPFTPRRSSRVSKPRVAFDNPNYNRRSKEARDLNRSLAALVKRTDKIHAPRRRSSSTKISTEKKKNAEAGQKTISTINLDEVTVKPLSDSSIDGSSSCSEEYLPKSPEAYCQAPEEKVERARRKSTVKKSKQLESRQRAQQRAELKAKKKKEREEAQRALLDKPPPGQKPYKCRYCSADFMTKSGIHYHQKLATCETTRCPFFIL